MGIGKAPGDLSLRLGALAQVSQRKLAALVQEVQVKEEQRKDDTENQLGEGLQGSEKNAVDHSSVPGE